MNYSYVLASGLSVDETLHDFVDRELSPALGIPAATIWEGLADLVGRFTPRNRELLATRNELQASIDEWHEVNSEGQHDSEAYRAFLTEIGYLVAEGDSFSIETGLVDAEIATIAGPQLVVPVSNARYALNAANARWGSLYDALYGTDALGSAPPAGPYSQERGQSVIAWAMKFLDETVPLITGSFSDVTDFKVRDGRLVAAIDGGHSSLADPDTFLGHSGSAESPSSIWLTHNNLAVEIVVDRGSAIGATSASGIADIRLESATTTIVDFEDSVAAVDGEDKAAAYRNWLGLMTGSLKEEFEKAGETVVRSLNSDREITAADGTTLTVPARSLLLVRNVGHLMTSPAVLDADGHEIPEGILDAYFTVAIGRTDITGGAEPRNSRAGSIYVVKPKMHGPDEVAFAVEVFTRVEELLGLPVNTVKLGIMDEERRTSVNLKECIRAARFRVAFINTGFLDRTGDEIHTSMAAGPVIRKAQMKNQAWIKAYEERSVSIGLAAGFRARAQIGKGMWAMPDLMHAMLREKIGHPMAGATCAWVPSPTAATLHATHYHRVDVRKRQDELTDSGPGPSIDELLVIPVEDQSELSAVEKQAEVDNNVQGILGYVVRWVQDGIGCSKVPDINDVALMEDRATCRISSQHVANWLRHGVVTLGQVDDSLHRMAKVVDQQNSADPHYASMAPDFASPAFLAARALIVQGTEQPNGYTEPILHAARNEQKRALQGSKNA